MPMPSPKTHTKRFEDHLDENQRVRPKNRYISSGCGPMNEDRKLISEVCHFGDLQAFTKHEVQRGKRTCPPDMAHGVLPAE